MQATYALSATVFFSLFIVGIMVYGGDASRATVLAASFLGAVSQFIAQDPRENVGVASVVVAYCSMFCGMVAFGLFVGGM